MDYQTEVSRVKDLLARAKEVVVATHEKPDDDSVGSALALYLGLASLGKKVTVACPDSITVGLSHYVGVDKIVADLSAKKNFIISLDYVDGSIEKVSYNIEGDKFNLVIEPRAGFDGFSQDKVHYSSTNASADLIFLVDTIHLGELKSLYEANKDLFASKTMVNVDWHPNNTLYGTVNIVDSTASTTAEVVARLLSMLGVKLTVDIATNLLNAVYGGTKNFTAVNISAGAFDVASVALKAGGKRFRAGAAVQEEKPAQEAVAPPPLEQPGQAPSDWLRPKIFKSSNLL